MSENDEWEPMGGLGERPARPGDMEIVGDKTYDAYTGQEISPPGPGAWRWTESGWERVKGSDYDARAIVRDLAATPPPVMSDGGCAHCGAILHRAAPNTPRHRDSCLWLRAVEWVGTQEDT
jgi:hypothetical protein